MPTSPRASSKSKPPAAALWVIVVLVVAGLILDSFYRRASEAAFDERLHVYLKTLVADLAGAESVDKAQVGGIGEPRFEVPLSGWYWQISQIDKPNGILIASSSLYDATLPHLADLGVPAKPGGVRSGTIDGPDKRRLRAVERTIALGADGRYLIVVAAPTDDIDNDIAQFRRALHLENLVNAG